jgi:hypothetical protein
VLFLLGTIHEGAQVRSQSVFLLELEDSEVDTLGDTIPDLGIYLRALTGLGSVDTMML